MVAVVIRQLNSSSSSGGSSSRRSSGNIWLSGCFFFVAPLIPTPENDNVAVCPELLGMSGRCVVVVIVVVVVVAVVVV